MADARDPERKDYRPYLSLFDFARKPTTRAGWYLRAGVTAVALIFLFRRVNAATSPLLSAKPPPMISNHELEGDRFGFPERTRREIFAQMAAAELDERARAARENTWNGHLWSREDDRGWKERTLFRSLAARHRASLSQMYLILDEGIRERWPGPDGNPLPATTPPLSPRQGW